MDILIYLFSRSKIKMVFAIVVGIVSGLGSAALISLINSALHTTSSSMGLGPWVFGGLGYLVLVTLVISTVMITRLGQAAARDLRMELCRRIASAPLHLLHKLGTPRLLANLTEDVTTVINAFQQVPYIFINIAWVFGCLGYLAWLSWTLFVFVASVITLGVVVYRFGVIAAIEPMRVAREQDDALYAHFRALTQGVKEIKLSLHRRDAFLSDVLAPTAESSRRSNVSASTIFLLAAAWGSAVFYFLIGATLYGATEWWGATKEIVTGYTMTILYMMAPLSNVVNDLPILGRASIALDKINQLERELLAQSEISAGTITDEMQIFPGELRFEAVSHRYYRENDERSFVLGPLDLVLQPGELIFITGGNGSGKSTLGLLLVGLYVPESGKIVLDDEKVSATNLEMYRQNFSVVFSDYYLFESLLGLVKNDLDEKARVYLAQLQLDQKVSVENGVFSTIALSQGQRKRLALLTAYLEDRPFYVFDEWAADQDPLFKEVFYTSILADLKARGKTVVVITHDDQYFNIADRCIKLENGKILEN